MYEIPLFFSFIIFVLSWIDLLLKLNEFTKGGNQKSIIRLLLTAIENLPRLQWFHIRSSQIKTSLYNLLIFKCYLIFNCTNCPTKMSHKTSLRKSQDLGEMRIYTQKHPQLNFPPKWHMYISMTMVEDFQSALHNNYTLLPFGLKSYRLTFCHGVRSI